MVSIKRAVSLGLSLDASTLRREVSSVARALRSAEDPSKSLSDKMKILEDEATQNEEAFNRLGQAAAVLELQFHKKQAAIARVHAELAKFTVEGKKAAAEMERLNAITDATVAIQQRQQTALEKSKREVALLADAKAEGLITGEEYREMVRGIAREFIDGDAGVKRYQRSIEEQRKVDEKSADAKRKLINALESQANPLGKLRTATADLNRMQREGSLSTEAAAAEHERLVQVYNNETGVTKRLADAQKVLDGYERSRQLSVQQGRSVLNSKISAEERIIRTYREELAALQALRQEEAANGNTAGVRDVDQAMVNLTGDRDAALMEERTRISREGLSYLSQFDNAQQRVNRRVHEAADQFRRGAITLDEFNYAQRRIIRDSSALSRGMSEFRSAALTIIGPLVLLQKAYEGLLASISSAAELQKAEARFRVFTGTATNAANLLGELRTIAANTPITFEGAQKATATMLQFNVATEDVVKRLKQLGEITGGDNDRLQTMALAFGQVSSAGRLMGQELIQLVNSGFSPLQEISLKTGESMPQLKKRMEDGLISFEEVAAAFDSATASGGRFNGMLSEIAKTTAGKIEVAKSKAEELSIAFGQMIEPQTQAALDTFISSAGDLVSIFNEMKKLAEFRGGLIGSVLGNTDEAKKSLDLLSVGSVTLIDGLATAINLRDILVDPTDIKTFARAAGDIDKRLGNVLSAGLGEEFASDLEAMQKAVLELEDIRSRSEDGKSLTAIETLLLEQQLEKERELKKVTNDKFDLLRKELDAELEKTNILRERQRLLVDFNKSVGDGFFDDKELAYIQKSSEELKVIDRIEKERVENQTRIEKSMGEQIQKIRDSINEAKAGIDAESLSLLGGSLNDADQKLFQQIINQAETLADIDAGLSVSGLEIPQANLDAYREMLDLQKQSEELKKQQTVDKKFTTDIEKLEAETNFLRDKLAFGEKQARINQLITESGFSAAKAATVQAAEESNLNAERKAAFNEELKDLRIKNDLTNQSLLLGKEIARINELRAKGEHEYAEAAQIAAQEILQDRDEQIAKIALEAKHLQEVVTLGEEQARINQLIRENGFSPTDAARVQELEKALDIEKKIVALKEKGDALTKQQTGLFADAIQELGELEAMLAQGFINQQLFDSEKQRVLDEAKSGVGNELNNTRAPKAIQKDSVEAFNLQSGVLVDRIKEQIKIAQQQHATQKIQADAAKAATEILNDIKQKPGVLPI